MRRKSQEKAFFDAATDMDEDMITETNVRPPRKFSRKVTRIASIVAVVALLLSVFFATDYFRFVTVKLEKGQVKQSWPEYSILMSIVEGLPLTFSMPEDSNWTVAISVTDGHFVDSYKDITDEGEFIRRENNGALGQSFSLSQTRTVYWKPWTSNPETGETEYIPREVREDIFVEAIFYSEGHIIGFALIEIYMPSPDLYDGSYSSRMLASGYFPKIFGQFQNVTEEYIQERFERAKK